MPDDRPGSFQPEKPHPQTQGGSGFSKTHLVVALISAAMVVMILTLAVPQSIGWVATLAVAVGVFAAVASVGYLRGRRA